jgi:hypothetical protein
MKVSLPDNRDVGEAVGDSNEGMKEARDRYDARQKMIADKSMEDSLLRQNMISAGSDFKDRPQDEGYRPYISPKDRATAEGAKDSGKIIENTGPRTKPAIVTKEELEKSGMSLRDYMNKQKGLTRRKEKDSTADDSSDASTRDTRTPRYTPPGSAPKQTTQKPKPKVFMPKAPDNKFPGSKFKSGGSVSSASRRADGIATKGKTRGKMC